MESLTQKQQKTLEFVEKRLAENNPPSQREIARHFGLARNAVRQFINYLKEKDYLIDLGGHRGLRLSEEYRYRKKEREGVPIVGRVAAGEPILAEENIDRYVDTGELVGQSKDSFLLKVAGDSMVDDGIMDGDFVVVEPASTFKNGQIGVVMLDDEATVKRIYIQRNRIALKSANRAAGYRTRYIKAGDRSVRIIGRVTGCLRTI